MSNTRLNVLEAQRRWAQSRGLSVDARGYLGVYTENLFRPLSQGALAAFSNGSGSELQDRADAPAKMRALHSSSALAVNVFDYWAAQPAALLPALDVRAGAGELRFEAQFPTGLGGTPPNLDVALRWPKGTWLGIESKCTEWLTPKPPRKEHFKPKYFPLDTKQWAAKGLPKCQEVAEAVHSNQLVYRYLDVAQLLKHALGLATAGAPFELMYVYLDASGPESELHALEAQDFSKRITADFKFHVRRYQDVIARIEPASSNDEAYIEYLSSRYLS